LKEVTDTAEPRPEYAEMLSALLTKVFAAAKPTEIAKKYATTCHEAIGESADQKVRSSACP
jgi:hypothetical protein